MFSSSYNSFRVCIKPLKAKDAGAESLSVVTMGREDGAFAIDWTIWGGGFLSVFFKWRTPCGSTFYSEQIPPHTSKRILKISAKFIFRDETNLGINQDLSSHFLMLGCLDWTKKKKRKRNKRPSICFLFRSFLFLWK